jgi:hypothetical protein
MFVSRYLRTPQAGCPVVMIGVWSALCLGWECCQFRDQVHAARRVEGGWWLVTLGRGTMLLFGLGSMFAAAMSVHVTTEDMSSDTLNALLGR